jgi:hypothetical protein
MGMTDERRKSERKDFLERNVILYSIGWKNERNS